MNFWQFLLAVFAWFGERTTRLLGGLQGTLAIVAMQGNLLPAGWLPWLMLLLAVCTYWRGSSTKQVYADAKAVIAQTKDGTLSPVIQPPEFLR